MANEILAALQGLLQGAASGAISRVEFDQKLREEAGKARLLEAQIRGGQLSPEVGSAIGKRAMGAGLTGPTGEQVNPQTTQEGTLLQGATGQEQTFSLRKLQEEERTKRAQLRERANADATNAKKWSELNEKINREINTRLDNERDIIKSRLGGIMTADGEAELRAKEKEIIHDVKYEYGAAWALKNTKVNMIDSPVMDTDGDGKPDRTSPKPPQGKTPVGNTLQRYLDDIATMTEDTIKTVQVPTKYQNNQDVIQAFAKRLQELGLRK